MMRKPLTAFCTAALALFGLAACTSETVEEGPAAAPEASPARDPQALMRLATRFASMNQLATAERLYLQAVEKLPDDPEPLTRLGHFYLNTAQYVAAEEAYARALERRPKHAPAIMGQARLALERGDTEQANALLDTAGELGGEGPFFLATRGLTHDLAGDHSAAQALYRDGLNRHRGAVDLRRQLVMSLALDGRYKAAREATAPLLRSSGGRYDGARLLALTYALEGETDRALDVMRRSFGPDMAEDKAAFYAEVAALEPADQRRAVLLGRWPDDRADLNGIVDE